MKTVYQAEDGTIFDDEIDCIRYENGGRFQMYDAMGKRTNKLSAMKYVFLQTLEELDMFIKTLKRNDVCTAGLSSCGFYMHTTIGWDHFVFIAGRDAFENIAKDIQEKDRA